MPDIRSVHVVISGRVQGVGFRAWTARKATALHLAGWVRNLRNGDVEAVFSGSPETVEAMLALCRKGPRMARVDNVETLAVAEATAGSFAVREDE